MSYEVIDINGNKFSDGRQLPSVYSKGGKFRDNMNHEHNLRLEHSYRTHDGLWKRGIKTVDSTGAFMVGELERLDQTMHPPLAAVSWGRDMQLREDVTMADEVSSFTLSTFGSQGGLGAGNGIGNGKAWLGKAANQVTGIGLDIGKVTNPLHIWAIELKYTIPELESAAKVGRPVDQQKYEGMQLKHQMDIDEQVYIGDTTMGDTGLVNNTLVTNGTNLPNGVSGSSLWSQKTPAEILADFNTMLNTVWASSGYAVMPSKVLIPPAQFGYISNQLVSSAGTTSILKYVQENNLLTTTKGGKLDIQPLKWLLGAGTGGTIGTAGTVDRSVVYTNDKFRVRFPMTQLQRTPIQYDALYHKTTYFCRLGRVEVVYPETISYFDGL